MQVFSREKNEGLVINDEVKITVLEIREDHVRLGFYSPRHEPKYWVQDLYCNSRHPWTPHRSLSLNS